MWSAYAVGQSAVDRDNIDTGNHKNSNTAAMILSPKNASVIPIAVVKRMTVGI